MKKFIVLLFFVLLQTSYSQWEACNNGLRDLQVEAFMVRDSNLYAGNGGDSAFSGVYYSSDNGNNWIEKNNGFPRHMVITSFAFSNNNIFGVTFNGLYFSTDNGSNWIGKYVASGVTSIATNGNYIFAGTNGGGVYLSTDNGNTWQAKNNGLNDLTYSRVTSLLINGKNIFASLVDYDYGGKIYLSADNGDNWTEKNNGLGNSSVSSFAINGNNIYTFTSGTNGGVYISTDNGDNWTKNDFLTGMITYSIAVQGNNIFASTVEGMFISTDNGTTWTKINNSGFINLGGKLAINNKYIFAAGSGVFRALLSDITNVEEQIQVQNSLQIYPNPVTDELFIKSSNTNPSDKIQIFSTLGIKVFESDYKVKEDVSNLAPGLYILKIGDKINKFIKM